MTSEDLDWIPSFRGMTVGGLYFVLPAALTQLVMHPVEAGGAYQDLIRLLGFESEDIEKLGLLLDRLSEEQRLVVASVFADLAITDARAADVFRKFCKWSGIPVQQAWIQRIPEPPDYWIEG